VDVGGWWEGAVSDCYYYHYEPFGVNAHRVSAAYGMSQDEAIRVLFARYCTLAVSPHQLRYGILYRALMIPISACWNSDTCTSSGVPDESHPWNAGALGSYSYHSQ
jgi:hypothetical protein